MMNLWLMLPLAVYAVMLWWFTAALWRYLPAPSAARATPLDVTVVVAARNEAHAVDALIESLAMQTAFGNRIQVVLADDHSTDGTAVKALEAARRHGVNLRVVSPVGRGKRAALDEALDHVTTPWLAFTDADCRPAHGWLNALMQRASKPNTRLVLGQVCMTRGNTLFQQLQSVEYQSIAAITAASAAVGSVVMANGASMAVQTDVYRQAVAAGYQKRFASGDDMFLLQYIRRHMGSRAIGYVPHNEAVVFIDPEPTLHQFVRQRLRWVSKAGGYTDVAILTVAAVTSLASLALVVAVVAAFTSFATWHLLPALFILKATADLPLLLLWSSHTGQQRYLLFWFAPLQLLYPFYAVGFGLTGMILKTRWR
jgi:cellulose synthase/poly-beta-1,6-N-acetylglucosamine synthase-like glycosyltransferase